MFSKEHSNVRTSRRGVVWTRCRVYIDGLDSNDEGEVYICREMRTRRSRKTSVLFDSKPWLGPGSMVDPTPFSLEIHERKPGCRKRRRTR